MAIFHAVLWATQRDDDTGELREWYQLVTYRQNPLRWLRAVVYNAGVRPIGNRLDPVAAWWHRRSCDGDCVLWTLDNEDDDDDDVVEERGCGYFSLSASMAVRHHYLSHAGREVLERRPVSRDLAVAYGWPERLDPSLTLRRARDGERPLSALPDEGRPGGGGPSDDQQHPVPGGVDRGERGVGGGDDLPGPGPTGVEGDPDRDVGGSGDPVRDR